LEVHVAPPLEGSREHRLVIEVLLLRIRAIKAALPSRGCLGLHLPVA
jgi:hypothetical protein